MSLTDLQDAKEQVRQAIDIVDLVGSYAALRRQGRGYVALCPWHDDSRPSLQVNPERQSFKCWVCDVGGDIFSFIMRMEGVEFREALEMLADRAGITLTPTRGTGESGGEFQRRNLLRAVAWAEQQFCECLLRSAEAEPARQYLATRGVSDDSIQRFHLGFAPAQWDWLLKRAQQTEWSPAVLERVGLAARRQSGEGFYDRFRGRLIFSIRDAHARPIAFGGRVLPELADEKDAKYINSPETPLFSKSSQLYALDLAREAIAREKGIVIMEGYTDVLMAHQHGIANAVAVLGTALGERHVPLVRRYTDNITLVLDGDQAGQQRTLQILDQLLALFVAQEVNLKILTLPQGADPCDVIGTQGSDAFRQLLSQSVDALDHKIQAVTNGLASAPDTHRSAQAVEEILGTLARAFPARVGASSAALVREQQVLVRLTREFGIDDVSLRTRLTALRRQHQSRIRAGGGSAGVELAGRSITITAWERELLELMIHCPETLATLAEAIRPEEIRSDVCRRQFTLAVELNRGGESLSFDRMMLESDDADAKSLLVECDEQGREKSQSDTKQRVSDLLAHVTQQRQDARHHHQLAELKQNCLDPQQEDKELAKFYKDLIQKQSKHRQTGSSPTDG